MLQNIVSRIWRIPIMKTSLLKAITLVFTVAVIGAGIYKWVDEKGVTHYSETPPPAQQSQQVPIETPAQPAPRGEVPGTRTWQQLEQEFQQRRIERELAEKEEAAQKAEAERLARARKAACITAQQNLHVLLQGRAAYVLDEMGERVYIADKDRPAWIARMKVQIEIHCPKRQ